MLPYALAIFSSAFLLFQVQPLIGKYILPWFGGGPGVWTTCLLFFQIVLLGGYAYAHFSTTRLKPRTQAIVHGVLLLCAAALLPIAPGDFWKSQVAGDPTLKILLLLGGTIGLPYFVLSSTGPLMQQWFSVTNPGVSPYRLYALSNIGSLLALLSYPTFFEVKFTRFMQAALWSAGFVVFILLCGFCAWQLWRRRDETPAAAEAASSGEVSGARDGAPSGLDRVLWVALPATASVLLLAVTNKLCQEIAVIPFLWVVPLSLYLLTFVICFDHARWYSRPVFAALVTISVAVMLQLMGAGTKASLQLQILCYTVALFLVCMFCHGELYQLKPSPRHLTAFYLAISAGGALGGLLVAVVAPAVFQDYRELPLGLWVLTYLAGVVCIRHRSRTMVWGTAFGLMLATFVLPVMRSRFDDGLPTLDEWALFYVQNKWFIAGGLAILLGCAMDPRTRNLVREWQPRLGAFVMALSVVVGIVVIVQWNSGHGVAVVDSSRNFYGTLKVYDYNPDDPENRYQLLLHGATTHGLQFVAEDKAMRKTTYYGETSGIGRALENLPVREGQRRIGLVGLGTGTLATYGRSGDYLRIYDINPEVERLARTRFTFLRRCEAKIDIVMGDARLSMEQELAANQPQEFDLLALDAFSSDAIPVHLLTKEALAIYLRHLKPSGVIAVHTSNRYLRLEPIVERLAAEYGLVAATIAEDDEASWWIYRTTWILLTRNRAFVDTPAIKDVAEIADARAKDQPLWTDDFASLFKIMR